MLIRIPKPPGRYENSEFWKNSFEHKIEINKKSLIACIEFPSIRNPLELYLNRIIIDKRYLADSFSAGINNMTVTRLHHLLVFRAVLNIGCIEILTERGIIYVN